MANTQGAIVLRQIRKLAAVQCSSQQSDLQLLQRFIADRDEAAFTALVQRHGMMILAVCRGVLRHQQDAEDVFQATFLVLARKAHTIRKQQALSSWLHGVAYRLALKTKTQANRRRDRERPTEGLFSASCEEDLTLGELRVIVHEELHRLPEKYRTPLLLCYWEGKTRDEAAEQIGVTAGAFKKYLERARSLLGSRLIGRGLMPSAALFAALFSENGVKAAVSSVLIKSTAQAAVAFARGQGASAGVSAAAALLAEGAIRTMNMTKWATTILAAILVGGLGTGLSLATYQALPGQTPEASAKGVALAALQPAQAKGKEKADQTKDKDRIVGTWRLTKGRADGADLPADFTLLARLTFTKDGNMTMIIIDEVKEGKYDLVGPGKIDLGPGKTDNEISNAIYKFDGNDKLTICASNDGKDRPTEFTADKGAARILFVLARAKPGEEKLTPEEIAKLKGGLDAVRAAAARSISVNNLKQIGLAIHSYHDQHKALPAHAIYSKDGKTPLLSWRVAILPYIEQDALYQQFKLDEPWDSPNNKKLIAKMPKLYEPVGVNKKAEGKTYYQVFTGTDTLFDGAKQMTFADIGADGAKGTANTMLAIEAKDPVVWSRPDDLRLPKEKNKMPAVGGLFKDGMNVLMCDGSVRFLERDTAPAVLRALVTPKADD